jgi:heme/copper-type cytochrome/quinol oxidase subunit 2
MKTRKIALLFAAAFALVLISCGSDDNNSGGPTCSDGIKNGDETGVDCGGSCTPCDDPSNLVGQITEDTTLDAGIAYKLNGTLSVESGAKLTIPAGTTISANVQSGDETNTYIVVQKGAQIDIQGTAAKPVVMVSNNAQPGDWGGLVIAGDATTTEGIDATAEVGQIKYGGSNDADNSGNISYLIIKHAGAQINAESQYNGLTLYAVGSGTTIDNVAMIDGEDDGVEFFGGTVSASNMYFENNQDDSVDWTEGWNGTLTNAYVIHTQDGFSTAVEADGANGNPSLVNFTAESGVGGTALQFKKESGATITGLALLGYTTSLDFKDNGALSNVQIEGEDSNPELSYVAEPTVDKSSFDWVNSNETVDTEILNGAISADRTLDAGKKYFLKGTLSVESGAKLTIPAGTKITADVETGDETSTYIVVQKGAQIDIQGTEASPVTFTSSNETPGDWGGLVIAGDATTTEGVDATAEVGQIKYGGTNDTDNSGSINYLIIRYAGAQINAESQYNGLSLYAVGSGTTIENIAMIDGKDDGVEFFGGTVSASKIYLENNEDDSVDWTEGWNGTITDTYVLHTKDGFSTAVEADGANGNPTITNFTAVSSVNGTALQFKKTSGATITGLSLAGYTTSIDMKDDGPLANVQIDGADADPAEDYLAAPTVDKAMFNWVDSDVEPETQVLTGTVDSDLSLDANINYFLVKTLSVNPGAKLTIPAGTKITADVESGNNTETYIVVQKGAQIAIEGTAADPVVMTSTGEEPGDWGGLVIAGNATTTEGVDATAEVGQIKYGGTTDDDNSGSIEYLVIKYAGAQINSESQYNGLTLYAVGSGTKIENVSMIDGKDDGVEFFGGTVSATNMYFENNEDDSVDWTEGWNGTLTNAYVSHTKAGYSTAVEADGANGNPTITNFTAIATEEGTALQFKKNSGATITNLYLEGYTTQIDMKDDGALPNVQIDGADANTSADYNSGTKVDISTWTWKDGN